MKIMTNAPGSTQPSTTPPLRLDLGDVFEMESSPYPMRVVACDGALVMFDVWWPHRGAWAMAKLQGDFTYYRLSRAYAEGNARRTRTDPLSAKEAQVHRPDLPFAVVQSEALSWYDSAWPTDTFEPAPVLEVSSIYLSPFGPRDSAKPPALLTADNGKAFTGRELLTKAKALQEQLLGDVRLTNGVGIYRAGIKKRIPSYYIWGAQSRFDEPPAVVAHAAKHT